MSKKGRSQRENAKIAKRKEERKRKRSVYIALFLGAVALFCAVAVMLLSPSEIEFKGNNGEYTDSKTGIVYLPTDLMIYELRGEYLTDSVYGRMDGEPVYVIDGVSSREWLIRKHESGYFTLYYGKDTVVPTLSSFDSDELLICTDGAVVALENKIEDLNDVASIISHIEEGQRVSKPESVEEVYTLRFQSKEYSFLYYCVKCLVTENGSFLYLYDENVYVAAPSVLDGYIADISE